MVRIVGCEISPPRACTRRHQPGGQPAGSDREKVAVDAHLLDDAVKALHRRSSPVTMNPPRAASPLVGGACSGCIKPIWRAVWRSAPRCSPRRPAAREQGLASAAYVHTYCKLPTLSDNHFAPDLRDRRPSSPRPRSGARFCACFSLPTFATGGGAFQERGMCPYLLSLKVGSLRYKIRLDLLQPLG